MTVGSEESKMSFTGAGSVAPVIFPYPLHANIELKITVTDALGLVTPAVEGVDYTLVIAGDFQTATVTPLPAWAAFANGKTVEIARLLPYTQAVDLIGNSKLPERVVEQMFDRAAMRDQQLLTLIGETTAAARLRFRGAYSSGLAYLPNDVVVDQNSTWVNTLGGMGVAPPVLPTLTNASWALLARHGDPGSLENSALMVLIETGPVATPPADRLHVFAKDVAGESHLFTKDVTGVETDLHPVVPTPPSFLSLTDTPNDYVADGRKYVAVNVGETALEFLAPADAAAYRANAINRPLDTDGVWSAADPVTLAYAAVITPDFSLGFDFVLSATGNFTLNFPTNAKAGQKGVIKITHSGAARVMTLPAATGWHTPGGAQIVLSGAASDVDILCYWCVSASEIHIFPSVLDSTAVA